MEDENELLGGVGKKVEEGGEYKYPLTTNLLTAILFSVFLLAAFQKSCLKLY